MKKEICMSCVNGKKALVPNNSSIACFCTHYNDAVYKSKEDTCEYYKPRTDETEMEVAINVIQDMANSLQIFPDSRQGKALLKAIDALKDKRPEGEWLKDEEYGTANRICPFCGAYDTDQLHTNFCARCGAKLNGEGSGIKKKMQDAKPSHMFDDMSDTDKIDAITHVKAISRLIQIKRDFLNTNNFNGIIRVDKDFIHYLKSHVKETKIIDGIVNEQLDHIPLFEYKNVIYAPLNEIINLIDKYINEEVG